MNKIKVGDLVRIKYNNPLEYEYCLVIAIEDNEIYGHWFNPFTGSWGSRKGIQYNKKNIEIVTTPQKHIKSNGVVYKNKEGYSIIKGRCLEINNNKIVSNNKPMKITNLVKKILDKDTRTLIKADFLDEGLEMTEEGTSELLSIIFLEKKEELVKIAKEKIKEEEKK